MAIMTFTDDIRVNGASDDGSTLSWTSGSANGNVVELDDVANDNSMDLGTDSAAIQDFPETYDVTGYVFTSLAGKTYAVFYDSVNDVYIIPSIQADADISSEVADADATSNEQSDVQVANCFLTGTRIETPDGPRPSKRWRTATLCSPKTAAP